MALLQNHNKTKNPITMIKEMATDAQEGPLVFGNALCGHLSSSLAMFLSG